MQAPLLSNGNIINCSPGQLALAKYGENRRAALKARTTLTYVKLLQKKKLHGILYTSYDLRLGLSDIVLISFQVAKSSLKIWVLFVANSSGHRLQDLVAFKNQRSICFQGERCLSKLHPKSTTMRICSFISLLT